MPAKRLLLVLLLALALPTTAGAATTWEPAPEATRVANVFAMRTDVEVRCYSETEPLSPDLYGAWGYTLPSISPFVFLNGPTICAGINAIASDDPAVPDWKKALGALVLAHESYHLRRWKWWGDEGKVECQAIRHWRASVRMLGASTAEADRLFPWALQAHWHLAAAAPQYNWEFCQVPGPG